MAKTTFKEIEEAISNPGMQTGNDAFKVITYDHYFYQGSYLLVDGMKELKIPLSQGNYRIHVDIVLTNMMQEKQSFYADLLYFLGDKDCYISQGGAIGYTFNGVPHIIQFNVMASLPSYKSLVMRIGSAATQGFSGDAYVLVDRIGSLKNNVE